MVMTVWVVAGLLSLAGALTYAELAAMMPRAGGEYVFIRQAYGSLLELSLRLDAVLRREHRRHRGSRGRLRHLHQRPHRRRASGIRGSRSTCPAVSCRSRACRAWPSPPFWWSRS